MKVLFFSHQADFMYGGEVVTLEFMRELKERGVQVHFASPSGPYLERAREVAVCHEVPSRQFSRKISQLPSILFSLCATILELRKVCEREGITLVHATSLKAMVYAWKLGSRWPVLWHHHDILPPTLVNSLWLRAISLRAKRILAPSNATRAALLSAGVAAEKVLVLRNGFRVSDWAARPPQKPDHLFRIGLVGEISRRKGSDRLEGLVKSLSQDTNLQFLVIGAGLSEPEFAAQLESRLASKKVRFLGRRTRMKELYAELDLLFVPSRQDPLPTVIVEAGLSGVPVVGTSVGGIPEMIENGENGFCYSEGEDPAEKVRLIRSNWSHFSKGAREIAIGKFDIGKLSEQLLGVYREVTDGA